MSNVVAFPISKAKADELIDIEGRQDLRQILAEVTGMLTKPCTAADWQYIQARLDYVQVEVACARVMTCL